MSTRYLLHFVNEHIAFRWTEFLALTSKNNCKFKLVSSAEHLNTRPFIIIELLDESLEENLIKSARGSYLLRDLYELWAQSNKSVDDLAQEVAKSAQYLSGIYSTKDQSFRLDVETFNVKLKQSIKIEWIKKMFFLDNFQATPNLINYKQKYCIMELNEKHHSDKEYYFGRHLASGNRGVIPNFSLKTRTFIANTSMDPGLSLITANAAKIKPDDIVFDPFVGSGSLLVAAAYLGAYVFGTDIDWLLLHGKSRPSRKGQAKRAQGESVKANFRQYNLENRYLDVLVSDVTRCPLRDGFKVDAIIADPPYGVREGLEKIGARAICSNRKKQDRVSYPSKVHYSIRELLEDLLTLSVRHLCVGGRLVYYLPVTKTENENYESFDDCIPKHPCLTLISYCEQELALKISRLMVVMEKIKNPEEGDRVDIPQVLGQVNFRDVYFQVNKDKLKP